MPDHPLSDAILDEDIAILGKKGSGKTYTAKGVVERLLARGDRVLILDPLGLWWGLRSSADGKSAGFKIAVFGGEHGDLPLDPAAAIPLADILARENVPAVLDVADLSKAAQQSFLLAFLRELRRVNREPLTIVLEEADVFAPQNPMKDDSAALLGEIDWISRRGRFRGFRLISITQRPAKLNKDVLTQASTLILHRLPAPQDRAAARAWIDGNGDAEKGRAVIDALPTMPVGEGWIWSTIDGDLRRARFPAITTLDTSATPKAGARRVEAKALAEIDLGPVRAALATTSDSASTNRSKKGSAEPAATPDPKAIEDAERRGYVRGVRAAADRIRGAALYWAPPARAKETLLETADKHPVGAMFADDILALLGSKIIAGQIAARREAPKSINPTNPKAGKIDLGATGLTTPQAQVLRALRWWDAMGKDAPTRAQIAAICGWKVTSGHLKNVLGSLSTAGLVIYPEPGRASLTSTGLQAAPEPDTGANVIDGIRSTLTGPQAQIFNLLLKHRRPLTRDAIAAAIGWSAGSGHLKNVAGSLRTLEIIDYPQQGTIALQDWARR